MNVFRSHNVCPKCGCVEVSVRHCSGGKVLWGVEGRCPYGEHLHRTCGRCYYVWFEAPLDAERVKLGVG